MVPRPYPSKDRRNSLVVVPLTVTDPPGSGSRRSGRGRLGRGNKNFSNNSRGPKTKVPSTGDPKYPSRHHKFLIRKSSHVTAPWTTELKAVQARRHPRTVIYYLYPCTCHQWIYRRYGNSMRRCWTSKRRRWRLSRRFFRIIRSIWARSVNEWSEKNPKAPMQKKEMKFLKVPTMITWDSMRLAREERVTEFWSFLLHCFRILTWRFAYLWEVHSKVGVTGGGEI